MANISPYRKGSIYSPFNDFYDMMEDFFPSKLNYGNAHGFKLDVEDKEDEYLVEAELSGVKKDEIDVTVHEGQLTIRVAREKNEEVKNKKYLHKERRYGAMQRSIYLSDISNQGVHAEFIDGLLKIKLPKEKKCDKNIKINID